MMRFGRILAVLAMLVVQPLAVVHGGNCPHLRLDNSNCSAGAGSSITADYGWNANGLFDDDYWGATISLDLSEIGYLGSEAAGAWNGVAWIIAAAHAYIPQGSCETITQAAANSVSGGEASISGSPPDVISSTGTSTFLIEDDGDNVQESVVVFGTITIELSVGGNFPPENYALASAEIQGPGISGLVTQTSYGGLGGSITYTDTSFNQRTVNLGDYFDGTTLLVTLETAVVVDEGDTFDVTSYATSGTFQMVLDGDSAAANVTSMASWAFESVAP
jgi:hypothetical protein